MKARSPLILTNSEIGLLRTAIAKKQNPHYAAWVYFRDGRLQSTLSKFYDIQYIGPVLLMQPGL